MKGTLLSIITAVCVVLFIAANTLNYVYSVKTNAVSMLDQTSDDTEESENQENESKVNEFDDDDIQFLTARNFYLSSCAQVKQSNFYFTYKEVHHLEVNSPPPQL